jgi:hypothetical protein
MGKGKFSETYLRKCTGIAGWLKWQRACLANLRPRVQIKSQYHQKKPQKGWKSSSSGRAPA